MSDTTRPPIGKRNPSTRPPIEEERYDQDTNGAEEPEDFEEKFLRELIERYSTAALTSAELETTPIIERAHLLGDWLREGDLGFIYGERGSGKTWLTDSICTSVSMNINLDSWEAHGAFPVIYVDGEMPMDLTRDRLKGLGPKNKNLFVLHHEHLYNMFGISINIVDPQTQKAITSLCVGKQAKLLVLDNLSCLASGMKENDADAWELLLNWLLELRRRRIAVIIVHHAGAAGQRMRGTTKREDSAAWVIKVKEVTEDPLPSSAKFETSFTKRARGTTTVEWDRQWTYKTENDGSVSIQCEEISFEGKVLQLIQNGLETPTQISDELGCSVSQASKTAKRLEAKKLIETKRRRYVPCGFMAAVK
jgi:AAA domain